MGVTFHFLFIQLSSVSCSIIVFIFYFFILVQQRIKNTCMWVLLYCSSCLFSHIHGLKGYNIDASFVSHCVAIRYVSVKKFHGWTESAPGFWNDPNATIGVLRFKKARWARGKNSFFALNPSAKSKQGHPILLGHRGPWKDIHLMKNFESTEGALPRLISSRIMGDLSFLLLSELIGFDQTSSTVGNPSFKLWPRSLDKRSRRSCFPPAFCRENILEFGLCSLIRWENTTKKNPPGVTRSGARLYFISTYINIFLIFIKDTEYLQVSTTTISAKKKKLNLFCLLQ